MKFCIAQPYYSQNPEDADICFKGYLDLFDKCDSSMDVIVFPEYCDLPTAMPDGYAIDQAIKKYNPLVLNKAIETAKRCKATLFVNFASSTESGRRNTTHVIDKTGNIIGRYYKEHPVHKEGLKIEDGGYGMDVSYVGETNDHYTIDIDGVRYGFRTCYDFYFYEDFITLARKNVDVIIGCSHQRTDTHNSLEIMGRFLSYNTNAYLVRSSISLGEDSPVCGCSMVVAPDGEMLLNMKNEVGLKVIDIDPKEKYFKPAGFRGNLKAHWEYVDEGRKK